MLYYQNTLINFPQTELAAAVPESLLLHDTRGRLVYLGGCGATHAAPNHTIYDHSQPQMRAMWAENVVKVAQANRGLVDGVFCDRSVRPGPLAAVLSSSDSLLRMNVLIWSSALPGLDHDHGGEGPGLL